MHADTWPYFYVSRVANDALALAFVGAAVWLLMHWPTGRFPRASAALVGGLLGLGTLTKLITVSLLPAALAYLLFLALCARVKWFTAVLGVVMIVSTYFVFTLPFLVKNIQHYRVPFVTQEAIINGQNGKSFVDSFRAIRADHIESFFVGRLIQENLWTSGWSFLMPDRLFVNAYSWILVIAFGGLLAGVY